MPKETTAQTKNLPAHHATTDEGYTVVQVDDTAEWDAFVCERGGHPLQLSGWAAVKGSGGWKSRRFYVKNARGSIVGGAQVLLRALPWPFGQMAYIPRGPVASDERLPLVLDSIREHLQRTMKLLYVLAEPATEAARLPQSWNRARSTILMSHTLVLNLLKTEEELLADISRKRRYDIRKSKQANPDIHPATTTDEIDKCLAVYRQTAARDGFHLHSSAYYHAIHETLGRHSRLIAVWDETGNPIAFTWLATTPEIAFELYAGMNDAGQQRRANYALKWWCILDAKSHGVAQYDFNGLLNDGISTFKKSFASHENNLVGSFEYPLSPLYGVWHYGLPHARRAYRQLRFVQRYVRTAIRKHPKQYNTAP